MNSLYRGRTIKSSSCSAGLFHNVNLLSMDALRSGTGTKAAFSVSQCTGRYPMIPHFYKPQENPS
jgi:hypothetical protein